jgi:hypothetical protein
LNAIEGVGTLKEGNQRTTVRTWADPISIYDQGI